MGGIFSAGGGGGVYCSLLTALCQSPSHAYPGKDPYKQNEAEKSRTGAVGNDELGVVVGVRLPLYEKKLHVFFPRQLILMTCSSSLSIWRCMIPSGFLCVD